MLLSDGAITDGLDNQAVLDQVVPLAVNRNIGVDVVGYAAPGTLDEALLQRIAGDIGGTYSNVVSRQELRRDFIKARHESTGTVVVDLSATFDPRRRKPSHCGRGEPDPRDMAGSEL